MVEPEEQTAPDPELTGDERGDTDGPDPRLGRVLGGLYRIDERIGEGGMGTVYRATHVHLGRGFAVKVLSKEIEESASSAVDRLRQEAVTASNLDHDHIVDVVSFDHTDEGDVFIAMELLDGRNLHDLVTESGPLPPGRAVPIAQQVARALDVAHRRHIVHRDLKPENVFVCDKDGADHVKVLDFGISMVKSADAERVRMTRTGQLMGTPLYMSPEQARGETEVDRRADVYALGCILYEMLVGRPPFEGRNYFQLLWKHGNEPALSPSERNPDTSIPPALEAVVMRALEKDPDRRYGTMADLDVALAEALPEHALPVASASASRSSAVEAPKGTSPGAPSRRRWAAGLSVAAVALAALAAWVLVARDDVQTDPAPDAPPASPVPPSAEPPEAARGPVEGLPVPPSGGTPQDDERSAEPLAEKPAAQNPATAAVSFRSRPPGADVHVGDGRALGRTPVVVPLPADGAPIQVRFSRRGYREAWKQIVPKEGLEVRVRLEPLPEPGGGTLPIKREL